MNTIENFHIKTATRITTTTLGIPKDYKQKCIEEIYNLGDSMDQSTNVRAIMSTYKIWEESKLFDPLIHNIVLFLNKFIFGEQNKDCYCDVRDCWGIVYKEGHYTDPHNHLNSDYSFVYYLECNDESSPLVFPDGDFHINPKNDMLVIFPSITYHFVPKQLNSEDRIVLAGNVDFHHKEGKPLKFNGKIF